MGNETETVNLETGEIVVSPIRRSPSIAKLIEAMAKASVEFTEVAKDTENPFYKSTYADLASLIKATRPFLGKNGLVVSQFPLMAGNRAGATTVIAHSSGEWMESDLTLPVTKQDAQGTGSAITYARRYAYQSVLNVAGEEDDDGNAAVGKRKSDVMNKIADAEDAFDQRTQGEQTLAIFQMNGLEQLAKTHGRTEEQIRAFIKLECGVDRIEKVLKRDFDKVKDFILGKIALQDALQTSVKAVSSPTQASGDTKTLKISEAQLKRLHAIRNKKQIPEEDVKRYVAELGGPEHLTNLDRKTYDDVCEWMEAL